MSTKIFKGERQLDEDLPQGVDVARKGLDGEGYWIPLVTTSGESGTFVQTGCLGYWSRERSLATMARSVHNGSVRKLVRVVVPAIFAVCEQCTNAIKRVGCVQRLIC